MLPSFVVQRVLWGVATAAVVAAAALRVLPPSVDGPARAPGIPDSLPPSRVVALDAAAAEEIVMGHVFAASRRPPSMRYVPPEFGADSSMGSIDLDPMVPDSTMTGMDTGPQLFGTVVTDGEARALLQLSTTSGPRLYRAGDRDGAFTVISVAPREVVLRGPGGRRTLRLEPQEVRR
jgi:hypothetical protein